jgi:hypothetical protein
VRLLWPWLVLAGLGAFHGLNPAMGWLFAVALGLHRKSRAVLLISLPSIALGHAISIAVVAGAVVAAGVMIPEARVRVAAGLLLIGWALYNKLYGHRHRVRIGMTTSQIGLVLWSFLMASAHGAGLMILPALMPLCFPGSPVNDLAAGPAALTALGAVAVHTGAMLVATAAVAFAVYEWLGLAILRSAWINVDLVWSIALAVTGTILLVA